VVLSACDTGNRPRSKPAKALQPARAVEWLPKASVTSVWSVPNKATVELMAGFYQRLRQAPRPARPCAAQAGCHAEDIPHRWPGRIPARPGELRRQSPTRGSIRRHALTTLATAQPYDSFLKSSEPPADTRDEQTLTRPVDRARRYPIARETPPRGRSVTAADPARPCLSDSRTCRAAEGPLAMARLRRGSCKDDERVFVPQGRIEP